MDAKTSRGRASDQPSDGQRKKATYTVGHDPRTGIMILPQMRLAGVRDMALSTGTDVTPPYMNPYYHRLGGILLQGALDPPGRMLS